MSAIENLENLLLVATESLEQNKTLLKSLEVHQEMIMDVSSSIVKISGIQGVPTEALIELMMLSRKLLNFQLMLKTKYIADPANNL